MLPPLPPLLLALQPRHDPSILSIEEAWELALTWRDRLRDKVLLERDPDETSGVTKSYKWIRFHIDSSVRAAVSAARAAAVTWFALSCCPGYGGSENPVFWRCVFSEFARVHIGIGSDIQEAQSITDAHGFFDGEGVDFPSFKLSVFENEANVLLFCGHPSQGLKGGDKVIMDIVAETLSPWIDQERTMRRPVVSLGGVRAYNLLVRHEATTKSASWIGGGLRPFLSSATRLTGDSWSSPVFLVRELDIDGGLYNYKRAKVDSFNEMLRSYDVEVPIFEWRSKGDLSRDTLAALVQCVLGLKGSGARAQTRELRILRDDRLSIAAFASALPGTTSIRSVRVNDASSIFAPTRIVWIAYALFHPDTPSSSWRRLAFTDTVLDSRCVDALEAMARGNSLTAMLKGREPTSDGYYRARLTVKASVYETPYTSLLERATRTAIVTSDGTLEVEVCDVASDDPKQWDKWVAVVVPAYGLGWCRSTDVSSVVKRPPAPISLTHLRVSSRFQSDPSDLLVVVVRMFGQQLVHLDVGDSISFASPTTLEEMLHCCPSLESLAVKLSGELWTTDDVEIALPKLRELRLHLDKYTREHTQLGAIQLPRSLQKLCIRPLGADGVYQRSAHGIRRMLLHSRQLGVFHWERGLLSSLHPTPYTETCAETSRRLIELRLPSTPCLDIPLPPSCAAAFWSVLVHQEQRHSALARLDQELAKLIVVFAGTTPSIVLEPDTAEIPANRTLRRHNNVGR